MFIGRQWPSKIRSKSIDKFTRRTLGGAITLHKCISFPPEVVCAAVANVNRRFDSPLSDRYRELIMSIQWQHSLNYLTGDGITIPHPNSVQNWVDNMATWPNITYSKICAYFVDSIATDGKAMDSLKASEAYQYLHSDKVGCVMSFKHDRFIYLKANVEPSQCLNSASGSRVRLIWAHVRPEIGVVRPDI